MVGGVWHLTRQQRNAMLMVAFLLVVGWAVKAWRLAHPPTADTVVATP